MNPRILSTCESALAPQAARDFSPAAMLWLLAQFAAQVKRFLFGASAVMAHFGERQLLAGIEEANTRANPLKVVPQKGKWDESKKDHRPRVLFIANTHVHHPKSPKRRDGIQYYKRNCNERIAFGRRPLQK
jgi:hypothetical protein